MSSSTGEKNDMPWYKRPMINIKSDIPWEEQPLKERILARAFLAMMYFGACFVLLLIFLGLSILIKPVSFVSSIFELLAGFSFIGCIIGVIYACFANLDKLFKSSS